VGEARQTAEKFYELFEAGDMDGAEALFSPDCVTVTPMGTLNNEEHKAFGQAFMDGLPDARMQIDRIVESGNEAYVSGRFQGTHKGDLQSPQGTIPASGNTLDMPFVDYWRVEGGKVVGHEVVWDNMGMMGQLGALPG